MRFFFIILFSSSVSWSQVSFKERHFDPVLERTTDYTSLQLLLLGTGSVLAVRPQDDSIRADWKNHQRMSEDTARTGDLLGTGAAGIIATGAQYLWDDNSNHYQSHARALVYSTLVNFTLKNAFQRPRPNKKDRLAFPSGHSMTAFTTATSLTYAYGWKAAVISYPMAVLVATSRLSDDMHWGSDVVGGAFVGIIMARASFYELKQETDKNSFFIYPQLEHEKVGAGFVYQF